ncbi:threonine/serine exporter ThrE family protein [Branchiibius sp. NY16-3462-2]|uniref:threonine/serine ThrE exporter family protein n=1 Tax=Branchiibius sp. NY16-3462-2 TaxID=1807500 RepID=UPI000799B419|nr:threonine/serine exporter family protein [Branchiibius sp. NY16-3462-2]KYH44515.1 hypothetical protein AZH51_08410 [Branchiibius sp. NY16-3462-2]
MPTSLPAATDTSTASDTAPVSGTATDTATETSPAPETTTTPSTPSEGATPSSPAGAGQTTEPPTTQSPVDSSPTTTTVTATTTTTTTTTSETVAWITRPASSGGDVPWPLGLTGVIVVLAAIAAGIVWYVKTRATGRRAAGRPVAPEAAPHSPQPTSPTDRRDLLRFVTVLGEAMLDISAPLIQVNHTLHKVATVGGVPEAEIITLPTALLVSVPGVDDTATAAIGAGERDIDLGQMQGITEVADQASDGRLSPRDGLARLTAIADADYPYPPVVQVAGYAAMSVGLALLLGANPLDLLVAAVLGGLTALVLRWTARIESIYSVMVVLGMSFVVASIAFLLARTGWDLNLLAALVPPLITFLPGAQLTNGTIDLVTKQIVSGSARLASGLMQLVLLAVGITAAASLVGVPASLARTSGQSFFGPLAPWAGVLIYGVGLVFYKAARPGARRWILLVLVIAYAGQVVGGVLFGSAVSAMVGAFFMTPAAMIVSTRPTGPPPLVCFLPAFWLLVPGALGLVGVTSAVGGGASAAATLVTTGTTLVTISLGVIAGLAVSRPLEDRLRARSGR